MAVARGGAMGVLIPRRHENYHGLKVYVYPQNES